MTTTTEEAKQRVADRADLDVQATVRVWKAWAVRVLDEHAQENPK